MQAWLMDLDGTLISSLDIWDRAHRQVTESLGGTWPVPVRPAHTGTAAWTRQALDGTGHDPVTASLEVERLVAEEFLNRGFTMMPGAEAFLARVEATGQPCAIVTAAPREVAVMFTSWLGSGLFRAVVAGEDVSNPKPAPDPYLRASMMLMTDPASCIAVEDSAYGIRSAAAAGCGKIIGVGSNYRDLSDAGATLVSPDLESIPPEIFE